MLAVRAVPTKFHVEPAISRPLVARHGNVVGCLRPARRGAGFRDAGETRRSGRTGGHRVLRQSQHRADAIAVSVIVVRDVRTVGEGSHREPARGGIHRVDDIASGCGANQRHHRGKERRAAREGEFADRGETHMTSLLLRCRGGTLFSAEPQQRNISAQTHPARLRAANRIYLMNSEPKKLLVQRPAKCGVTAVVPLGPACITGQTTWSMENSALAKNVSLAVSIREVVTEQSLWCG